MSPVDPPRWRRSSTIRPWCHHLGELVVRPSAPNNIRPNTPRRHANRHASWHSPSPRRPQPPLVLSPSLPPVPGKLDPLGCLRFPKRAAGDNIAFRQRLEETNGGSSSQPWWVSASHPHMQSIHSPLQWVYTMLLFIAVRCPDEATRQLVTYTRLVLHLAQKHGGTGWLDYDHTFRAQAAATPITPWNAINPSLMASAVLAHLCQEVGIGVCPWGPRSRRLHLQCCRPPAQNQHRQN